MSKLCRPALALALLLAASRPARADETVEVTVAAIVATERNADIHPKLRAVAREIQKVEPKLTGYRLGRTTCKHLTVGVQETFRLIERQDMDVTIRKSCGKDGKVELTVKPPLAGDITYTTCCKKYFLILTRYQTKDHDRLILAVMVQPCRAKKQ
jgi:hypothetical protein